MYQGKRNIQPSFLCKGDKVALVSPAYWVPEEAILQAAEILREWDLVPVIGPHTTSLNVDAYAGTADDIQVYNDAKLELTRANSAVENVQSALDVGKPSNEVDSRIDFAKQKLDEANKAYNNL